MNKYTAGLTGLVLMVTSQLQSQPPTATKEASLSFSIEINAPLDSVWSRWTTPQGLQKFFAPSARFEPTTLGYMEILFMPSAPEGQRGSENNRVLAIQDKQMISFTWDAPPQFPEVRKNRTVVILRFYKVSEKVTLLTFHQLGWGTGPDWDTVYNYFAKAWGEMVLPQLKYSLEVSPVDWRNFPKSLPKGLPAAAQLKE